MSKYLEKSKELRADVTRHFNCAQGVVIPFAEDAGLTDEQAFRMAANFGAGMRFGSVCGAITGGLMALGIMGMDDERTVQEFIRRIKGKHSGCVNCADLLRLNKEEGTPKKVHCDGMVFECVELVEEILKEKALI